jgi:hypothetical protein
MKAIVLLLLFSIQLYGQLAPPTASVNKKQGDSVVVAWNYGDSTNVLYFSLKSTYSLDVIPQPIAQIPASARSTTVKVQFYQQNSKAIYYVVSAVIVTPNATNQETLNSNTLKVARIGAPP